jgi:hypothetical protein
MLAFFVMAALTEKLAVFVIGGCSMWKKENSFEERLISGR